MRFTGGDEPIQLLCSAGSGAQRFFRGLCVERKFVFAVCHIGERFDSGAFTKFANGHPESAINFLGWNHPRAHSGRRGNDRDLRRVRQLRLSVSGSPLGHHNSHTLWVHPIVRRPFPIFASDFDDFPATRRLKVINFASLFSGTTLGEPGSVSAGLRLTFCTASEQTFEVQIDSAAAYLARCSSSDTTRSSSSISGLEPA